MFDTAGSMYIEVFLIDNLLMDLLILRLAAAMLSKRAEPKRTFGFALFGAAAAAFAAAGMRFLYTLPAKLVLTSFMALSLEPGLVRRVRTEGAGNALKCFSAAFLAAALSSLTVGGAVLAVVFITDHAIPGPALRAVTPRAALAGMLLASRLPKAMRRTLLRRTARANEVQLAAELSGENGRTIRIECTALIDTGNGLIDPLTSLPAVVLSRRKYPQAAALARIPIPVRTASGSAVIYALRPLRLSVNGRSADALIAFSEIGTALVPPCIVTGGADDIPAAVSS